MSKIIHDELVLRDLETNDCTVVAISQAYDISYINAHKLCEAFGREFRRGFYFNAKLAAKLKMQLILPTGEPKEKPINVSTVLNTYYSGIFICLIPEHVLCIKDGKRLDGGTDGKAKVIRLWRVK